MGKQLGFGSIVKSVKENYCAVLATSGLATSWGNICKKPSSGSFSPSLLAMKRAQGSWVVMFTLFRQLQEHRVGTFMRLVFAVKIFLKVIYHAFSAIWVPFCVSINSQPNGQHHLNRHLNIGINIWVTQQQKVKICSALICSENQIKPDSSLSMK